MRPLWASSILRVSWTSSTIGKCPRCEAGRTVGTGAPRFSSRSTTGGGVSTRAARHMQGFGRFGRSRRGGGTGAFPALTSIRAKRRQAHERKEADMDENGKRRTMRGGARGDLSPHDEGAGAFSTWLTGDCMEPTLRAGMMGVWVPRIPEVGEIGLYRSPPYGPRTQQLARIRAVDVDGGRVLLTHDNRAYKDDLRPLGKKRAGEGGIMFMGTLVEVYEPVRGVNLKALPEE